MARLTKDVSLRAQKLTSDSVIKAPSKTLIIPAHELVQIVAKVFFCTLRLFLDFMYIREWKYSSEAQFLLCYRFYFYASVF